MECATLFSGPSSFGSKPEPAGVKIKETRQMNGSKIFRKCRIDAAEERLDLVRPASEDFGNPMQEVQEHEVSSHHLVLHPPHLSDQYIRTYL